jgi:hypothetical protein
MMPGHASEGPAILVCFHVPAYGPARARIQPSNLGHELGFDTSSKNNS